MTGTERPSNAERTALVVAMRLAALALLAYLLFSVIHPFLGLALWSGVLTVALFPIYDWVRARLGGRDRVAAGLITSGALLLVFGPIALLLASLIKSVERIAIAAKDKTLSLPDLPPQVSDLPWIGPQLSQFWQDSTTQTAELLRDHGHVLIGPGESVLRLGAGLAGSVVVFAAAVAVAGILLVPGPRISALTERAAGQIAGPRGTRFIVIAKSTIRGVARGIIGVALLQALLLGIVLIGGGIPHAGLLTLLALILTLGQIGMSVVIVPVVIWVWMTHATGFAIVFTLVMLPISAVDNVLKPIALGQGLETPMLVILAGVIGGLVAFGVPGLFVGPTVLAVCYELVMSWLADPDLPDAAPPDLQER